jgi:hypothetical protein
VAIVDLVAKGMADAFIGGAQHGAGADHVVAVGRRRTRRRVLETTATRFAPAGTQPIERSSITVLNAKSTGAVPIKARYRSARGFGRSSSSQLKPCC